MTYIPTAWLHGKTAVINSIVVLLFLQQEAEAIQHELLTGGSRLDVSDISQQTTS